MYGWRDQTTIEAAAGTVRRGLSMKRRQKRRKDEEGKGEEQEEK